MAELQADNFEVLSKSSFSQVAVQCCKRDSETHGEVEVSNIVCG